MNKTDNSTGKVIRIAGPVVGAIGLEEVRLFDVVHVGEMGLVGEVIRLSSQHTTIQVYEDTSGIRVGEPVHNTGLPLVAHLGPGLLGSVYDGLQRPLEVLAEMTGDFIQRGVRTFPLPENTRWRFTPRVNVGELVSAGNLLGVVPESSTIEHHILVSPGQRGRVVEIYEGEFKVNEVVALINIEGSGSNPQEVTLVQRWPVRQPRPIGTRLAPREPLITGTRIIDRLRC
jgi:V/A-type H+-transporting ATPase subunit A